MPITITVLPPDGRVGPGLPIGLTSDVFGPFPTDTQWHLRILGGTTGEAIITESSQAWTGNIQTFIPQLEQGFGWSFPQTMPAAGSPIRVTAEIIDRGIVQDAGSRTAVWEPLGGLGQTIFAKSSTGGGGGLSETQALQLSNASLGTTRQWQIAPDVSSISHLADLIAHPPLGLICKSGPAVELSGRGELAVTDAFGGWMTYGAWWQFIQVPPGTGVYEGIVPRYQGRLMQLATVHPICITGSDLVYSELLDVDYEQVAWFWSQANPLRVVYDLRPGVVASWRWLRLSGF